MNNYRFLLILVCLQLITFSCSNTCKQYLEKVFRPLNYNMVVTAKYIDIKYYRIIGQEPNGNTDTTEEISITGDIYEQIEIGDTIFKEKGSLDLVIMKKDTTITIPYFCN